MTREQDLLGFPALFYNQRDPASILNDAVVHQACLRQKDYGGRALAQLDDANAHRTLPKLCDICGRSIDLPEDYFATGPIGEEVGSPLSDFSWLQMHHACLRSWDRRAEFESAVSLVSRSPEWEGDVLERLLAEVNRIVCRPD